MSDEIKNTENEATKTEPSAELTETALDEVAGGGKVTFQPFSITRKIDSASPKLYES